MEVCFCVCFQCDGGLSAFVFSVWWRSVFCVFSVVEISVLCLQCGIELFCFLFCFVISLWWRSRVFCACSVRRTALIVFSTGED